MALRWSALDSGSNPYEQYLAMLGMMPGAGGMPQIQGAGAPSPAIAQGGTDHFSTVEDLPKELRDWLNAASIGPNAENMPAELKQLLQQINQSGIGPNAPGRTGAPTDPNNPLANMSAEELLQLLIDYFANEMHQQKQNASPPRSSGNMGGGQQWSGTRPASWPSGGGSSGGGSSGGGSSGGTSSGGGGGGGPGGPLQSRTNGAGLPSPGTGQTGIPGGLQTNAANGARVVRELGFGGVIGGIGQRSGPSDHPDGNAIDVMTQSDVNKGREVAEHFRQNADQLGVKYVIYQQQIASPSSNPPWSWRPMEDRGDPTANHMDHVHISFH